MVLKRHEQSSSHRQAVETTITIPSTTVSIDEQLCHQLSKEKEINRGMLIKIISSVRFLARQGLALRGDGSEDDGNFYQMLKVKVEDDPGVNA